MKIFKILLLLISVSLVSCVVVKHEEEKTEKPLILKFSPQPEMEMSDIMVRSDPGDMIAFIPDGWFLVNLENEAPSDVISVAVNKEYTLSVVFRKIKKDEAYSKVISKEGLLGLARLSLEQRVKKTAGSVQLAGKYSQIDMGPREFAKYEFTNADKTMSGVSAVFISSLDEYYEMTVIPMNLTGIVPTSQYEINRVFSSVLATVQY